MTAKNRAGLIAKLHTSLKKHYKPAPAAPGRPLLEHILYAALLEDAPVDLADEGFAKCEQEFFDWNEVRVTSVTELAEVLSHFPSPPTTSARLKRCLQSVFEAFYNFDIDHLKKENLGKAVAKFEAMSGMSPFVLAYLVQHGLGGHAIPVNSAAMHIMLKAGIVNEPEARTGKVPGLERAVPKSKAIEFSSMLHQAAVALQADPLDKAVWEVILSVNKNAEVSAPKAETRRKSLKRPVAKTEPAEQPSGKAGGKPKAGESAKAIGTSKSAGSAKATATGKPAASGKPTASGKPAASGKATASGKPAASGKAAQPSKAPAAPSAASKAVSKTAKPAAAKSRATGAAAAPSGAPAQSGSGRPASGGKAVSKKAAPASSSPAKKSASMSTKKPASTPPAAKPPSAKGPSKMTPASAKPAKGSAKKSDLKKSEELSAAVGSGNQKLTKRKPR